MKTYPETLTIKAWAEADRPREKLLHRGQKSLTDAELLAIIIGSGTTKETAGELGKKLLSSSKQSLEELSRKTIHDLCKTRGIGPAKAISIVAALELGRRRKEAPLKKNVKVGMSRDAFHYMELALTDLDHEEFWIALLNRNNYIIDKKLISRGGVTGTVADPKIIFKHALQQLACGVILYHNHPSGNLEPSESDVKLTHKLKRAGDSLDINIIDHLIIASGTYFSFRDEGLL